MCSFDCIGIKYGDIKTERDSSFKHHVRSNVKHKTKGKKKMPMALNLSKEYREYLHGRLKVHSRNLQVKTFCGYRFS